MAVLHADSIPSAALPRSRRASGIASRVAARVSCKIALVVPMWRILPRESLAGKTPHELECPRDEAPPVPPARRHHRSLRRVEPLRSHARLARAGMAEGALPCRVRAGHVRA